MARNIFYMIAAWVVLFVITAWIEMSLGAEVTLGPANHQATFFNVNNMTFKQEITVANGPGGPRDFVGLYASSAPTAVLQQWLYLDNTKNQMPEVLATRKLTGGTVTFLNIPFAAGYEARFYQWMPAGAAHQLIQKVPISPPPARLERRTLAAEAATVTRHPVGNRDEVIIKLGNGVEEHITMDRGVLFDLAPVLDSTAPHTAAILEP